MGAVTSGPEHYKEAERLTARLEAVVEMTQDPKSQKFLMRTLLAEAQVHATLALAAATVEAAQLDRPTALGAKNEWREAIS